MKKLRKVLALVLAMVMVLGMSTITAFADTSGYTITINGAQKGGVYTAYKIFDATTTANGIAYTVKEGSALETMLRSEETTEAETEFLNVFNITDNGGKIYVTEKAGATDIVSWMKKYAKTYAIGNPTTVTNSQGAASITLDVGANGYYFITSTVGTKSAVMLTSAKPNVTINDKIETTPTTPENAKKIMINGQPVDVTTLDIGTEVTFNVTINATNYVTKDGESSIIYKYKVEDTPQGFSIDKDSVRVQLNQNQPDPTFTSSVDNNGKLTVDITWADGLGTEASPYTAKYITPSVITVSYKAKLTNITKATNSAVITYNDSKEIGKGTDEVYNYTVTVDKIDKNNTQVQLPGAEFAIAKTVADTSEGADEGATKTVYYNFSNNEVTWVDNIENATTKWTSTEGTQNGTTYQQVVFEGLAAGSYTLVEVTAPMGYNLAADKPFTLNAVKNKLTDTASLTVRCTVEDEKGGTLPSTGGMGTTLFYVFGAVLVIGAGIVLVTRRRMAK